MNELRQMAEAAVVFDVTAHVTHGSAVYVTGAAAMVPDDELAAVCDVFTHPRAGADVRARGPARGEGAAALPVGRADGGVHLPGGHELGTRHNGRGLVPPAS